MKLTTFLAFIGFLLIAISASYAKEDDYLAKCWKQQGETLQEKYLKVSYHETVNRVYHSMAPWQTYRSAPFGQLWINATGFFKHDTIQGKKSNYFSATEFNSHDLLITDFGDTSLSSVTQRDVLEYTFESARYAPALIIHYFIEKKTSPDPESNSDFAVYRLAIGKTIVSLYIRRQDCLLEKITMLASEDILGDVMSTFHYTGYSVAGSLSYARTIHIEKKNGMLHDTVNISSAEITSEPAKLLKKPSQFTVKADEEPSPDSITTEKFSDHIHFIIFKHADSKAMVVEFDTYLLVAESPLTSSNGELLIEAAEKIAPGKPIKYFTYGHWHPWYLGGVRPFIYNGTKIICPECDSEYMSYLAKAPHTLKPDRLQTEPKKLYTESLKDSLKISDGKYSMTIYMIGKESDHTQDYSIFYFPQEKMLFEGDLAWIKKGSAPTKPDSRQTGLYNAIKKRNLDVSTVIQAWPVAKYNLKSVFLFSELENSMNVK